MLFIGCIPLLAQEDEQRCLFILRSFAVAIVRRLSRSSNVAKAAQRYPRDVRKRSCVATGVHSADGPCVWAALTGGESLWYCLLFLR